MRGWIADYFRSLGAPWYWNVRKALFVRRGRRDLCPCHNPSDSGEAGATRCEAVTYWHSPARFSRHVCPLLKQNAAGEWRCSVGPEGVRTYWWRPVRTYAVTAGLVVGVTGFTIWGTMRAVGFPVSLRQIFWPQAWSELGGVRAEYFRQQSAVYLSDGRFREALAALTLAYEMQPDDYPTAMLLAQINHLVRPEVVDAVYRQIYARHPARRDDTSRVWFRSLLARGQMEGVAELSRRQLVEAPKDWPVWLHGLLFTVRATRDLAPLEATLQDEKVPVAARAALAFELKLRRAEWGAAKTMLTREPLPNDSYLVLQRVERLLEWNDGMEALQVLQEHRALMPQRDYVRLTLAAHAVAKNSATLDREIRGLLSREGDELTAGVTIIGQHLVRFPNYGQLEACREAFRRLPPTATGRADALAALYSAAAVGGRTDWLAELRLQFADAERVSVTVQQKVEQAFAQPDVSPLLLLSVARPLSIELNYAILERALATAR